jgi:hypothetical protein
MVKIYVNEINDKGKYYSDIRRTGMTQMVTNCVEEEGGDAPQKYGEGRSRVEEFRTLIREEEKKSY